MNLDDQVELAALIEKALRDGGLVDPDDGTMPMWPNYRRKEGVKSSPVWVSPTKVAAHLAAALTVSLDAEIICTRCGIRGHASAWCRNTTTEF